MKTIVMESGKRIEMDEDAVWYVSPKILWVLKPTSEGWQYEPIGKVKEIVEEEEE